MALQWLAVFAQDYQAGLNFADKMEAEDSMQQWRDVSEVLKV